MTFSSHYSKRPVQLVIFFALLSATFILPPSMLPDVVSKNTTAQAFIVGCEYAVISMGESYTLPAQDSDGDGAPDCWDPCPNDADPLCGLVDYEFFCKATAALMGEISTLVTGYSPHAAARAAGGAGEVTSVAMAEYCKRKYDDG